MMLALLVYAYYVGERSSRGIERRCREDVAFRVVCANQLPDHATIARFRVRHQQALAELFGQVLGLCAEAGLVRAGVIAVDGSKFRAAAPDSALSGYAEIAAELLADAERIDAAEDERYGRRGAMSCPGSSRAAGDDGPGFAPQSGASTPSERPSWSRFRGTGSGGLRSAIAASSRTGAPSTRQTVPTRPIARVE
jgi:hypothetical protein